MNIIYILLAIFFSSFTLSFAKNIKTIASFNDHTITSQDLISRKNLKNSLLSIGKENFLDVPLLPKSINAQDQLEKEVIIKIMAKNYGINFTEEEVITQTYALFSKYGISYKELKNKIFKNNPTLLMEYRSYMSSYLLWMKIIRSKIIPNISISYPELKELAMINRIKTTATKLKLYEIYLRDENVKNKAIEKIDDLRDFKDFAQKFSQSPTSSSEGLIGWIKLSDLNKKMSLILRNLEIESISEVKEGQGGYYLYMIEEKMTTDFIDPKIKQIIHNALLERKIMAYVAQFFIEVKKNYL
jgi:parvulin-like peptidyl-prolyl isomerase